MCVSVYSNQTRVSLHLEVWVMLPNSLLDGVRARVDISHGGLRRVGALARRHAQLRLLPHYLDSRLVA